jgi:hypothetical protein
MEPRSLYRSPSPIPSHDLPYKSSGEEQQSPDSLRQLTTLTSADAHPSTTFKSKPPAEPRESTHFDDYHVELNESIRDLGPFALKKKKKKRSTT